MTSNTEKAIVYFQIALKKFLQSEKQTVAPSGKDANYNQTILDSKYAQT